MDEPKRTRLVVSKDNLIHFIADASFHGQAFEEVYVSATILDEIIEINDELKSESKTSKLSIFKKKLLQKTDEILELADESVFHGLNFYSGSGNLVLSMIFEYIMLQIASEYPKSIKLIQKKRANKHILGFIELYSLDEEQVTIIAIIEAAVKYCLEYAKEHFEDTLERVEGVIYEIHDPSVLIELYRDLGRSVLKKWLHPKFGELNGHVRHQIDVRNLMKANGLISNYESQYPSMPHNQVPGLERNPALSEGIRINNEETNNTRCVKSNSENSRTRKLIIEIINNVDKSKGWEYAFRLESDYHSFVNLLTEFFEFDKYKLPTSKINLQRGCKTRFARTLGDIYRELKEKIMKGDSDFFKIIRVLSEFSKMTDFEIYKSLNR